MPEGYVLLRVMMEEVRVALEDTAAMDSFLNYDAGGVNDLPMPRDCIQVPEKNLCMTVSLELLRYRNMLRFRP